MSFSFKHDWLLIGVLSFAVAVIAFRLVITNQIKTVFDDSASQTDHARQVAVQVSRVSFSLDNILHYRSAYLISGDTANLQNIEARSNLLSDEFEQLRNLVADDLRMGSLLDSINIKIRNFLPHLTSRLSKPNINNIEAYQGEISENLQTINSLKNLLARVEHVDLAVRNIQNQTNKLNVSAPNAIFVIILGGEVALMITAFGTPFKYEKRPTAKKHTRIQLSIIQMTQL